jgi:hypothetical protein
MPRSKTCQATPRTQAAGHAAEPKAHPYCSRVDLILRHNSWSRRCVPPNTDSVSMLQLSNDFGSFSNGKPHFERAPSRPDIAWVADAVAMLAAADEMNEWETSTRLLAGHSAARSGRRSAKCGRLAPQPTANLRGSPGCAQPTAILLCQIEIDSNRRSAVSRTQVLRFRIRSVQ